MTEPGKTLSSVGLAMDIIEELKVRSGVRLSDLATALDRPKSTIHYQLNTLLEKQFVRKDAAGRYHLAFRFVELAHFAREPIENLARIRKQVDALAEESGEISVFSVPEHWYSVCLHLAEGEDTPDIPMFVGRRHPLHATAVGKSMLAHMPESKRKHLVEDRGLDRLTDRTITDPADLSEQLEAVRDGEVAYNRGENLSGVVGVGLPILDRNDDLVGGISVYGAASQMDDEKIETEIPELLEKYQNMIALNFTEGARYSWENAGRG